ncbi:hypothetical protein ABVE96_10380 [Lactiplantibacillus plantarum]|uniref:hypothetical protein n=1 Tax=Lactiplantibacillus plantarum TaxID=1590 RepID=UPI0033903E05
MSNETKRDVFNEAVNELEDAIPDTALFGSEYIADLVGELRARYAAALPDNLPVIPKAVGEFLNTHRKYLLGEIFWKIGGKSSAFLDSNELYIVLNSDTFVRAWLLGVWRVEETGEIVKLEERDDGD